MSIRAEQTRAVLSGPQRAGVVLVPWLFVVFFAAMYVALLLPRMREGQWLAVCVGVFAAFALSVFFIAAITFSRDVLTGHWPAGPRGSVCRRPPLP